MKKSFMFAGSAALALAGCAGPEADIPATDKDRVDSVQMIGSGYEATTFTPKAAPYMQCVHVVRGGVDCWEKKERIPNYSDPSVDP